MRVLDKRPETREQLDFLLVRDIKPALNRVKHYPSVLNLLANLLTLGGAQSDTEITRQLMPVRLSLGEG